MPCSARYAGAATRCPAIETQATRAQARIGEVGDAQRDVEALCDDVDTRVGEVKVDFDARMPGEEVGEERCDAGDAEAHRRGEADTTGGIARRIARGLLGGARLGDDPRGMVGKRARRLGQREAARGAVEE